MRLSAAALLILGAAQCLPALAFEVGSYRLGMTSVQAARVGLNACAPDRDDPKLTRCEGVQPALPDLRHPVTGVEPEISPTVLWFDTASKRLVRILVVARPWGSEDPRTPALVNAYKLRECAPAWKDSTGLGWTCYALPDRQLHVGYLPEVRLSRHKHVRAGYEIDASYGPQARLFAQERAKKQRREAEEARRQHAAQLLQQGR